MCVSVLGSQIRQGNNQRKGLQPMKPDHISDFRAAPEKIIQRTTSFQRGQCRISSAETARCTSLSTTTAALHRRKLPRTTEVGRHRPRYTRSPCLLPPRPLGSRASSCRMRCRKPMQVGTRAAGQPHTLSNFLLASAQRCAAGFTLVECPLYAGPSRCACNSFH